MPLEYFKPATEVLDKLLNYLRDWRNAEQQQLEDKMTAVAAITAACMATRKLTQALADGNDETEDGINGAAVSDLWLSAAKLVAPHSSEMFEEFTIKAYGWRTGEWDHEAFENSPVPRRVEEILVEAMALIADFQKNRVTQN